MRRQKEDEGKKVQGKYVVNIKKKGSKTKKDMNDRGKEEEEAKKKKKRRGPVKVEGWLYFGFCGLCCTHKSNQLLGFGRLASEQLSYELDTFLTVICSLNQCCLFFYVFSFVFVVVWCVVC